MNKTQKEAMSDLLYNMGHISFCTYLYRTDILKNNSIRFSEDAFFGEDREFNWKYLAHCERISCVNKCLYFYRPNPDSATRRKATWRNTDALLSVERVYEYLKDKECLFAEQFFHYLYARTMWHVAKNFAISRDRELYERLIKEYDVKSCMKVTLKDKNFLVSFSSLLFLLRPSWFFNIIGLKKR